MSTNSNLGLLPRWDLTALFSSKDDARMGNTLVEAKKHAEQFQRRWRGTITTNTSPSDILQAIQEYEAIYQLAVKPVQYAHLLHAADSTLIEHGALVQRTQTAYTEISNLLLFFELEFLQLPDDTLQYVISDEALSHYRNFLVNLQKTKPHRLSENEEHIMTDLSLTGNSAFIRLFDEEFAHKKFAISINGAQEEWPEEKILTLLYNTDQNTRKKGATAMTAGLTEDLRRNTYIFNTLGQDKHIRDTYQKFETPESSRHLANQTTQVQVDTMSSAVSEAYGMVADYYNLKREVLGLDELFDYDRYAPISESERVYSFPEAKDMVLDAFGAFSPVMRERAEEFFTNNWIDAETKHGKRGGAFCSYNTPDTHPVVFLHYLGSVKHVLTLAHELGHGVHGSLMRKQTLLNFDTPLTIAETASVFGEMLVFDTLRGKMSGKEKQALYAMKIEELFAVIFRQHAMYAFEQDFHTARRAEGELPSERISEIWMQRQKEMFGSSVTLTADYRIWWSYIPHFLHTPFYVYAYVYGELLVLSLYDIYLKASDKEEFARKYIEMLEAGGTKTPEELVQPFDITISAKEFWQGGLTVVKNLIDEVKQMR